MGLSQTVEVREDGSFADPEALVALNDRARAYVSRALPGLDPEPVEYLHCWVTSLPWSEDGMAVWETDRIFSPPGTTCSNRHLDWDGHWPARPWPKNSRRTCGRRQHSAGPADRPDSRLILLRRRGTEDSIPI
ncbi:hypothetical protein ACFQ1B_00615 [Streptomyces mexicanus]